MFVLCDFLFLEKIQLGIRQMKSGNYAFRFKDFYVYHGSFSNGVLYFTMFATCCVYLTKNTVSRKGKVRTSLESQKPHTFVLEFGFEREDLSTLMATLCWGTPRKVINTGKAHKTRPVSIQSW